ncbi:hypothetical protein [Ideonella sp. BN130291]|uniref:hypothetical protein n=1 Tax=Ideonella sp. BN130291 TaxID=3112940 RepID=UPI002E2721A6|nr:hypothetical protein [Ideonella sp. BN130291]
MFKPSSLLRRALLADALASGASGALLSFDAAPLGAWFGLPASLLQTAGIVSLAYAVLVAWLGTRDALWRPAVWAVVAGNVAWALGSVELLFTTSPSTLGLAYVIAQALLVAVLAELQFMGLRRSARMTMQPA